MLAWLKRLWRQDAEVSIKQARATIDFRTALNMSEAEWDKVRKESDRAHGG